MSPALLRLRYRPNSDVLSGEVVLPFEASGDDEIRESPDADTHLVWWRQRSQRIELLRSFHVVHASSRLADDPGVLPSVVAEHALHLIRQVQLDTEPGGDLLALVQARAEAEVQVPQAGLARPEHELLPPDTWAVARADIDTLVATLARLADLLSDAPTTGGLEAGRTLALVRLLRELGSVIRTTRGRTSPGTTAAARRAVRGGVPLTSGERRLLKQALAQLDSQRTWPEARAILQQLADSVAGTGTDHASGGAR